MDMLLNLVPVFGIIALLFAAMLASKVSRDRQDEGDRRFDQ